jgi:hypothetical protein
MKRASQVDVRGAERYAATANGCNGRAEANVHSDSSRVRCNSTVSRVALPLVVFT